ncbi:MAG: Flagellin protein FlaA, partial [uncultured Solirubrobacteraceae bacterium]
VSPNSEQRGGAQRAPPAHRHQRQGQEVDGAPLVGLPHQPRWRRRGGPRHLGAHALADPRSRPGAAQHPGRRLDGADRRGCARRGPRDAPAHPRARRPVQERLALDDRPDRDPVRGHAAPERDPADREPVGVQRHQAAERQPDDHVPGRRERHRPDRRQHDRPLQHDRRDRVRPVGDDHDRPARARQRHRRGQPAARVVRRHPEPPRAHARRHLGLPGEPGRRRVAHPRRGHGRGDGDADEAADPLAGQPGDARPGEPAAAVRAAAAARL